MSGVDRTTGGLADNGITRGAPVRRFAWPLGAGVIIVTSALLWAVVFQSMSWLGVF